MSNYKKQLGSEGELLAKNYLINKGFTFLFSNFRFKKAEIDLVFKDDKDLVFVEVKTRNDLSSIDYNSIISDRQQEMLKYGANGFINKYDLPFEEARFDVVVISSNFKNINYIPNAF